jgi:methylenetetrahydrofolate--tRNA-(uracil-5-)-methyltransferase
VPAGQALAVDRDAFARAVTEAIANEPRIEIDRQEITKIPEGGTVIVASGPLTSESLAESIRAFTGEKFLYFYDAISPIVEAETIDESIAFRASRYGKGSDDYLNCPMSEHDYRRFYEALRVAATIDIHDIDQAIFFESCLPIEVMARRGFDTLRFGPMKPVGLVDPRTGKVPFAVVQLRQDNLARSLYNIVGFQNQLKWGEQKRLLRLIPGLENAEFVRYGMIHRNTYINAPALLHATLQTRARDNLFFAGQLSGVEGYTESAASGLLAGINAAEIALGRKPRIPPRDTSLGALAHYISHSETKNYQPTNISFGLLPPLEKRVRNKKERKKAMVDRALVAIEVFSDGLREPATAAPELDPGEQVPSKEERKKVSSA